MIQELLDLANLSPFPPYDELRITLDYDYFEVASLIEPILEMHVRSLPDIPDMGTPSVSRLEGSDGISFLISYSIRGPSPTRLSDPPPYFASSIRLKPTEWEWGTYVHFYRSDERLWSICDEAVRVVLRGLAQVLNGNPEPRFNTPFPFSTTFDGEPFLQRRTVTKPDKPSRPGKNAGREEWFEYKYLCDQQGVKFTHEAMARELSLDATYVRGLYATWKSGRGDEPNI